MQHPIYLPRGGGDLFEWVARMRGACAKCGLRTVRRGTCQACGAVYETLTLLHLDVMPGNTTLYDKMLAVTLSDTTPDSKGPFAALYVTVAGNLRFVDGAGNDSGVIPVPVGIFPVSVARVWATGTTATVLGLIAVPG